jgi:putative flippase GtrA
MANLSKYSIRREVVRSAQFVSVSFASAFSNLLYTAVLSHLTTLPFWFISLTSTEFSMVVNFVLNDSITFRNLESNRPWYVRLGRFQIAAIGGNLLTTVISVTLNSGAGFSPVVAQVIAIVVAFFVNFVVHRFWTFKSSNVAPEKQLDVLQGGARVVRVHLRSRVTGVSVVVPVLNEAATMPSLLIRIHDAMSALGVPYETLVIDDHSNDDTVMIAQDVISEQGLPARVMIKKGKLGKSYSLMEGFAAARYPVLAMIDGDLELPPESLPKMIDMLGDYDVVVGRRLNYQKNNPLRKQASVVFNLIFMQFLLGINVEAQTGIKVFWKHVYESTDVTSGRWSFDMEFIAKAIAEGFRVGDRLVPFQKRQAGKSKVNIVSVTTDLVASAIRIKLDILKTAKAQATMKLPVLDSTQLGALSFDANGKLATIARDLHIKMLLGYAVAVGLVYSACFLVPYGMTDAYTKLYNSIHGTMQFADTVTIKGGRPLLALLTDLSFGQLRSYEDLRFLVVASILGIIILAWVLHQTLIFAGFSRFPALVIPLLICTAPAFQVYAAWAVCAYYPYAAALAGIALMAVEQGYRSPTLKKKIILGCIAFIVFVCALFIYQPAAMMYWVFAAIFLLTGQAGFRATWLRFIFYALIAGAAYGIALASVKLAYLILPNNSVIVRSALVEDYLGKSQWFVHVVMLNALNLYNVTPTQTIAIIVAVVIGVGLLWTVEGSIAAKASKLVIAIILAPLCYLPNLVVADDWASYRTQVALTSLVILYLCYAILSVQKFRVSVITSVAYAGLFAFMLVGGYSAARNVTVDFAIPQYQELALMRDQLASPTLATATSVYLIPATWEDSFAPEVRYDEYGVLSSSVAWSEKPMVYFVLHDINPSHDEIPVIVAPPDGPFNPPPGSIVIDMRPVKNLAPYPPNFG